MDVNAWIMHGCILVDSKIVAWTMHVCVFVDNKMESAWVMHGYFKIVVWINDISWL